MIVIVSSVMEREIDDHDGGVVRLDSKVIGPISDGMNLERTWQWIGGRRRCLGSVVILYLLGENAGDCIRS